MMKIALLSVSALCFGSAQDTITNTVVADERLSGLKGVLTSDDKYQPIIDALSGDGPFTLFAPSNDAIAALTNAPDDLTSILMYHVLGDKVPAQTIIDAGVPLFPDTLLKVKLENDEEFAQALAASFDGTAAFINGVKVSVTDIECTNGVIHIIDAVLTPPVSTAATATAAKLDILVGLVVDAGLVDAVNTKVGLTIFAPLDSGFPSPLPANLDVSATLLNHVVPSVVFSTGLSDGQEIETLGSAKLTVSIVDDVVKISGSQVVSANVITQNGVVHVVDAVIGDALVFVDGPTVAAAPTAMMSPTADMSTGAMAPTADTGAASVVQPVYAMAAAAVMVMVL